MTGGAIHFDYRLHDGPSSTRNAIALLDVPRYGTRPSLWPTRWPRRTDSGGAPSPPTGARRETVTDGGGRSPGAIAGSEWERWP